MRLRQRKLTKKALADKSRILRGHSQLQPGDYYGNPSFKFVKRPEKKANRSRITEWLRAKGLTLGKGHSFGERA